MHKAKRPGGAGALLPGRFGRRQAVRPWNVLCLWRCVLIVASAILLPASSRKAASVIFLSCLIRVSIASHTARQDVPSAGWLIPFWFWRFGAAVGAAGDSVAGMVLTTAGLADFFAAGLAAGFLALFVMLMLLRWVATVATVGAASTRLGCASPAGAPIRSGDRSSYILDQNLTETTWSEMKTPYIRHTFGEEVSKKLRSRRGWLTAGVASSISWPSFDVCIEYAGDEFFLRGSELDGKPSAPGITVACNGDADVDATLAKIFRFTSMLSWFEGGYVDVADYVWSSHPILCGGRGVYSSMGIVGAKSFNCNHMPVIDSESVRKALAFWREGRRLHRVHDSYAFLSFYKVIESQFRDGRGRGKWITDHIDQLTDRAGKRVAELRASGIDVSQHLFDSGRCAVAHASLDGEIVHPDVPADRRRLSADLVIIEELARIYIRDELRVPDSRSLYRTRNRLEPWDKLLRPDTLEVLRKGGTPKDVSALTGLKVDVGLWPDGPIPGLERTTMHVDAVENGVIKIVLVNERQTILLVFFLDYRAGRVHTNLEDGGLLCGERKPDENDARAYATFFYKVFGNGIAELTCGDCEPIDCEVVIPVNMYLATSPEKAIEAWVEQFQKEQAGESADPPSVQEPPAPAG